MTKRELLLQICEQPGFAPAESSAHSRFIEELNHGGWIQRRGNGMREGWEATPRALDEYPDFASELASAAGIANIVSEASRAVQAPTADVSRERAVIFVRSLLTELPMDRVAFHAAQVRGTLPPNDWAWRIADDIVDTLLAVGRR